MYMTYQIIKMQKTPIEYLHVLRMILMDELVYRRLNSW